MKLCFRVFVCQRQLKSATTKTANAADATIRRGKLAECWARGGAQIFGWAEMCFPFNFSFRKVDLYARRARCYASLPLSPLRPCGSVTRQTVFAHREV